MRRCISLVLLLPLAACAAAGTTAAPVMAPNSNRVISAEGRAANFGSGAEVFAAPWRVEAPFDSTWAAVLAAFGATELPVQTLSEAAGQITSRLTVQRRMLGVPASTFLTCGGTIGVAEMADASHLDVQLQILVVPKEEQTQVQILLGGTARDRFTNTQERPCLTRGILEARLAERIRERLGIPTEQQNAARRLPLGAVSAGDPRAVPLPEGRPPVVDLPIPRASHPLLLAAGAAVGGAMGTTLGAQVGENCEQRCLTARGTLGPLIANTLLIPIGSHLANRRRGSLVQSVLASAGWSAAAAAVGGITGSEWAIYAVVPGQLFTSVLIERASTGRR